MKLDKKFLYWLFLIAIGFAWFLWATKSNQTISLQMTSSQAQITKSAVCLVINQIEAGKLTTFDSVVNALKAEIPSAISEDFIARLDSSNFSSIVQQLKDTTASIQITE